MRLVNEAEHALFKARAIRRSCSASFASLWVLATLLPLTRRLQADAIDINRCVSYSNWDK